MPITKAEALAKVEQLNAVLQTKSAAAEEKRKQWGLLSRECRLLEERIAAYTKIAEEIS